MVEDQSLNHGGMVHQMMIDPPNEMAYQPSVLGEGGEQDGQLRSDWYNQFDGQRGMLDFVGFVLPADMAVGKSIGFPFQLGTNKQGDMI